VLRGDRESVKPSCHGAPGSRGGTTRDNLHGTHRTRRLSSSPLVRRFGQGTVKDDIFFLTKKLMSRHRSFPFRPTGITPLNPNSNPIQSSFSWPDRYCLGAFDTGRILPGNEKEILYGVCQIPVTNSEWGLRCPFTFDPKSCVAIEKELFENAFRPELPQNMDDYKFAVFG
jgi:hypothetical protein